MVWPTSTTWKEKNEFLGLLSSALSPGTGMTANSLFKNFNMAVNQMKNTVCGKYESRLLMWSLKSMHSKVAFQKMVIHSNASTFVLFHMDTKVFLEQIAQDLNTQQSHGKHIIIHRFCISYMKMPLKPLNVEEVRLVFVVCQMLWSSL